MDHIKNQPRDHRIMEFWWVRSPDHGISLSEITGSWNFGEWDHRIMGFRVVDHEIARIKTTRSWKIRDQNHGIIYFHDPAKMDHKIIKNLWSYDLGPWSMGLKLWKKGVISRRKRGSTGFLHPLAPSPRTPNPIKNWKYVG